MLLGAVWWHWISHPYDSGWGRTLLILSVCTEQSYRSLHHTFDLCRFLVIQESTWLSQSSSYVFQLYIVVAKPPFGQTWQGFTVYSKRIYQHKNYKVERIIHAESWDILTPERASSLNSTSWEKWGFTWKAHKIEFTSTFSQYKWTALVKEIMLDQMLDKW